MLRVVNFVQFIGLKYNYIWISLRLVGGVLVSLIYLGQVDLKAFLSSLSNLSILVLSLLSFVRCAYTLSLYAYSQHGKSFQVPIVLEMGKFVIFFFFIICTLISFKFSYHEKWYMHIMIIIK